MTCSFQYQTNEHPHAENVITNISFGGAASSQPTYLDDVQCDGTEPSLLNCSYVGTGTGVQHDCGANHGEDVGIICEQSRGDHIIIKFYTSSRHIDLCGSPIRL